MKKILIITLILVVVLALAVFTGSWIFNILSVIFDFVSKFFGFISKGLLWLADIFNIFGWNNGIR